MNTLDLFAALGDVDDALLADIEVDTVTKGKCSVRWLSWVAVAACAVLVVLVSAVVVRHGIPPVSGPLADGAGTTTQPTHAIPPYQSPAENTRHGMTSGELGRYAKILVYAYSDLCEMSDLVVFADVIQTYHEENAYAPSSDLPKEWCALYAEVCVRQVWMTDDEQSVKAGDRLFVRDNAFAKTDENGALTDVTVIGSRLCMEAGNRVVLFLKKPDADSTLPSGRELYTLASEWVGKMYYDADDKCYAAALFDTPPDAINFPVRLTDYTPLTPGAILRQIDPAVSDDWCGTGDILITHPANDWCGTPYEGYRYLFYSCYNE